MAGEETLAATLEPGTHMLYRQGERSFVGPLTVSLTLMTVYFLTVLL